MVSSLTLTLSLPSGVLSPNWRGHWGKKSRAVKAARTEAHLEALNVLHELRVIKPLWAQAQVQAVFHFRDVRRRDRDNLLAMLKPTFDGIADAGIVGNDAGMIHMPVQVGMDKHRPRLVITIAETA